MNCAPEPDKHNFESKYFTHGPGQVACDEGTDVVYPDGSPGFAYDPTGMMDKSRWATIRCSCIDILASSGESGSHGLPTIARIFRFLLNF